MKAHRIIKAEADSFPHVSLTFDDGLAGTYDVGGIAQTAELASDCDRFRTVAVSPSGTSFGWDLDIIGCEIDFCADAARIAIETDIVQALADQYASRLQAAE